MKILITLTLLVSLLACQNRSAKTANIAIGSTTLPTTESEQYDSAYVEHSEPPMPGVNEYYVDSTGVGCRGKNKVELARYVDDSIYVLIRFYTKLNNGKWKLQQEFHFEKDLISDCDMRVEDFNNDGFNDMTYVSSTAARGANEVRRLFIYDNRTNKLVYIKNSEEYPNMQYNNKLHCIDAYMVYGCCQTAFLYLQGDSLKLFASVEVCEDRNELTVAEYDKNGNQKILQHSFDSKFSGIERFENYNPLEINKHISDE